MGKSHDATLKQAGLRVFAFQGEDKEYQARLDEILDGPMVGRFDVGLRRDIQWFYPLEALREVLINALAHRDWRRFVEIEVGSYSNRFEVISPGALPNSMSVEKMKAGQRSPRNAIVMEVLRDYGYVDYRGMGVRTKIVPLTRALTGKDAEFVASEDALTTVLYR